MWVYRSIVAASQSVSWLVGQLLKLRFDVESHAPSGLFERGPDVVAIFPEGEIWKKRCGASWLRKRALKLYERAARRGEEER